MGFQTRATEHHCRRYLVYTDVRGDCAVARLQRASSQGLQRLHDQYSVHMFGHKEIFSSRELAELFDNAGLDVLEISKFHELSFPYEFYLRKMIRSELGVRLMLPLVRVFFALFKIRNKAFVVGRKRAVPAGGNREGVAEKFCVEALRADA